MSYSLWPHELHYARLPWPSPSPRVCSDSVHCVTGTILCCPLLLLPSFFPSIMDCSTESTLCIRLSKYRSFSFSISPPNAFSGLLSCRIDWFDLLAVQGTLLNSFEHHSSKASILWHSAFFIVQLSHPYMTTGKTIALIYGPSSANWCLCFLICCLV